MSRARGQPPRRLIDRQYPHQVLLPAENVGGKNLDLVIIFHAQIDAPIQSRSIYKEDRWYALYSFSDPQHAKSFQALFGGEIQGANR